MEFYIRAVCWLGIIIVFGFQYSRIRKLERQLAEVTDVKEATQEWATQKLELAAQDLAKSEENRKAASLEVDGLVSQIQKLQAKVSEK